jgi:uncharacterized damage-inducible protein DinB
MAEERAAAALVEAWLINDRINRYLLDALSDDQLAAELSKGKAVRAHFAHIHNVRLMWLKASAPELNEGLDKLDGKTAGRDDIGAALTASDEAVGELIARAGGPEGKIKGFKPHAAAFVGYLCAHESFHRAHIELALRQAGMPIDDKVAYGMWEWGVR